MGVLACLKSESNPKEFPSRKSPSRKTWEVGSRYAVQSAITVRAGVEFTTPPKDAFEANVVVQLLLRKTIVREDGASVLRALIQDSEGRYGWCSLEVHKSRDLRTDHFLSKVRQGGWHQGGRYRVGLDMPLCDDVSLQSACLCDLHTGEEVVVLDFAVTVQPNGHLCQRAQVVTHDGQMGWVSCYSSWDCLNLDDADLDEASPTELVKPRVVRRSLGMVLEAPWVVEGQYQILQEVRIQKEGCKWRCCLTRRTLKIGEKVVVKAIKRKEVSTSVVDVVDLELGASKQQSNQQFSLLVVCENDATEGWIDAQNKNGASTLDSRDLLAFDKAWKQSSDCEKGCDCKLCRTDHGDEVRYQHFLYEHKMWHEEQASTAVDEDEQYETDDDDDDDDEYDEEEEDEEECDDEEEYEENEVDEEDEVDEQDEEELEDEGEEGDEDEEYEEEEESDDGEECEDEEEYDEEEMDEEDEELGEEEVVEATGQIDEDVSLIGTGDVAESLVRCPESSGTM